MQHIQRHIFLFFFLTGFFALASFVIQAADKTSVTVDNEEDDIEEISEENQEATIEEDTLEIDEDVIPLTIKTNIDNVEATISYYSEDQSRDLFLDTSREQLADLAGRTLFQPIPTLFKMSIMDVLGLERIPKTPLYEKVFPARVNITNNSSKTLFIRKDDYLEGLNHYLLSRWQMLQLYPHEAFQKAFSRLKVIWACLRATGFNKQQMFVAALMSGCFGVLDFLTNFLPISEQESTRVKLFSISWKFVVVLIAFVLPTAVFAAKNMLVLRKIEGQLAYTQNQLNETFAMADKFSGNTSENMQEYGSSPVLKDVDPSKTYIIPPGGIFNDVVFVSTISREEAHDIKPTLIVMNP